MVAAGFSSGELLWNEFSLMFCLIISFYCQGDHYCSADAGGIIYNNNFNTTHINIFNNIIENCSILNKILQLHLLLLLIIQVFNLEREHNHTSHHAIVWLFDSNSRSSADLQIYIYSTPYL